ncbi:hypothetical protein VCR31J2_80014 [Vibrio coralliirubri]|uniref:Uncharacterized protein n=1 Tax=Vibrio coralliirubri TaxID=1516159 RepID=A0AA86X336_9VIBR|nr:hypothetical protein VCR31J2_80014 [Vibrio coralliirubri]
MVRQNGALKLPTWKAVNPQYSENKLLLPLGLRRNAVASKK